MEYCNQEVPSEVLQAMKTVYSWMEVKMYADCTIWNHGEEFNHMRDASDFLNQFLLDSWEEKQ